VTPSLPRVFFTDPRGRFILALRRSPTTYAAAGRAGRAVRGPVWRRRMRAHAAILLQCFATLARYTTTMTNAGHGASSPLPRSSSFLLPDFCSVAPCSTCTLAEKFPLYYVSLLYIFYSTLCCFLFSV